MDALIIGAAPEPGGDEHYRSLLSCAPFVIAADAAAEWALSLDRLPDLAVGDFDSAEPGAPARLAAAGVEVVRHPVAKDASDLDLALDEARARGRFASVTFAAVTSGRLDHTLAALGTLASAADLRGELDEPSLAGWALIAGGDPLTLTGPPGALVSVFAVGSPAEGVTLDGFRYPLRSETLSEPSTLGLSNELTGRTATIRLTAGRLLVLAPGVPGRRAGRP